MIRKFYEQSFTTREYELFPTPFIMFTVAGFWCPDNWSSRAKFYYNLYTLFQVTITVLFGAQVLAYDFTSISHFQFDVNSLFGFITVATAMYKAKTFIFGREWIIAITEMAFNEKFCKPQNDNENKIIKQNNVVRWTVHITYFVTLFAASITKCLAPYFRPTTIEELLADNFINLPMPAWYPYDVLNPKFYNFTFFQQLAAAFSSVTIHIAGDVLMSGLMLQMCLQCRILKYRILNNMSTEDEKISTDYEKWRNDRKVLTQYVIDHRSIIAISDKFNLDFMPWMVILIFTATPNLLLNFLGALKATMYDKIAPISLLIICMSEISLLCWCGNEVSLHSIKIADSVFESNWSDRHMKVRKDYLLIMARAFRHPMNLTIANIIPLNVESMVKILKLAYSALQVLRQV